MKRLLMLLAIGLTAASVQAATVTGVAARPSGDILAESNPDGTDLRGFDAEEKTPSNVRYAWGQSFTTTADWEVDKISMKRGQQYAFHDSVDLDAQYKVVLIEYDSATFDADSFGPFSNPLSGATSVEVLTETFTWAVLGGGTWMTFDLTTNAMLNAGSEYAFLVFISNPDSGGGGTTGGSLNIKGGAGLYAGGARLKVNAGNTIEAADDLNFVIQGSEMAAGGGTLIIGAKPSSSILVEQVVGSNLLAIDAEERIPNTRHSWGQSFTAVTDWSLSSVAVEAGGPGVPGDADTLMKVAVFEYDENTFTNDAWGTFSDPFSNATTTVLYEETFSLSNSAPNFDWITMNLSSTVDLTAGNTYGFALWKSDPNGSTATLRYHYLGGSYNGGNYLRARGDTGNDLEDGEGLPGDLNFVLQGDADLAITQFETSESDLLVGLSATLSWFAIAADSISIDLEGGANVITTSDQSGTVDVTPPGGTNTYVMIATDSVSAVTSSVEIVVSVDADVLMLTAFDNAADLGSAPEQYEDTPAYVIADLGPTVDYDCTAAYGLNASTTEMGIKTSDGKTFIGATCRQMSGAANGLAEAIANGVYIEMRLDSATDTAYELSSMDLDMIATRGGSGTFSWGVALLFDLNGDSSYTADESLAEITATVTSGTIELSTNVTLSTVPELIGVVDPTFRFYLWENYDAAYAAKNVFGIESITLTKIGADEYTTPIFVPIEQVGGELKAGVSNMAPFLVSTLQATEDLVATNWVDIATTTGVAEVEWVLPTTDPVSFFRVISE